MTRRRLYTSSLLLLLATAPWWFGAGAAGPVLLGLPGWAVYSLAVTAAYAITLAVWLGRYWELSAGGGERPEADGDEHAPDRSHGVEQ